MTEDPRSDEPDFDDLIAAGVDDAAADFARDEPSDADERVPVEAEIVHDEPHDETGGVEDLHAFFGIDEVEDVQVLDEQFATDTGVVEAVPVDDGAPSTPAPPSAPRIVDPRQSASAQSASAQSASAQSAAASGAAAPSGAAPSGSTPAGHDATPFWMQPPASPSAQPQPSSADDQRGSTAELPDDIPTHAVPTPPSGQGWMLSEEVDLSRDQLPPETEAVEPAATDADVRLEQPDWGAIARTEVVPPYEAEEALAAEDPADVSPAEAADEAAIGDEADVVDDGATEPATVASAPVPSAPTPAPAGSPSAPRDDAADVAPPEPAWSVDGDDGDDAAMLAAAAGTAAATPGAAALPATGEVALPTQADLEAAEAHEDALAQDAPAKPRRQRRRHEPAVPNPIAVQRAEARAAILEPDGPDTDDELAQAAIDRVRGWLATESDKPARRDRSAERLAGLLQDPKGLEFAITFVDRVIRPEDPTVSAKAFEELSREIPDFLDWYLKLGVTMGGGFGILAPAAIIPIAKRAMRQLVSHLVIDATPERLGKSLQTLRADGLRLNVNLLGEAVLGEQEAERRLAGTIALLERDDVDYVSVKVSNMAPQLNLWSFDETVERVIDRLLPLYRVASAARTPKFINLDMEEYRDLDLTIAVFTGLLDRPEFHHLEAGIVLQAYLPDALGALEHLTAWAQTRTAAGLAGIKVRIVKGANLAMERVDAAVHGWALATEPSKAATDANYKRVLRYALQPEHAASVRVGVAGHNLFDLAYAIELAERAGTRQSIDVEMLLGMADEHIAAVRRDVDDVLLYTPVVSPTEFDSAVAYLVRRLEENGSGENFMSGMYELGEDAEVWEREKGRFLDSIAILHDEGDAAPPRNRTQDRTGGIEVSVADPETHDGFFNEPDSDPSLAPNRAWARRVLERAAASDAGLRTLEMHRIDDVATLDRRIEVAVEASSAWAARGAEARALVLREGALALGAYRGRLLEVMAAETGKTIAEGDPEVSEAIDFCRFYAEQAIELERVEHAEFQPVALTVVTPPWNFPVAIPCGGVVAALATGSSVIIKPAPQARRTAAVLLEALWEAGVPRDVLHLADMEEGEVSKHLITHPAVGRLILTGSSETAALFTSWRPDLPLLAETSGKNAIIVTPSADLDLAAGDLAKSAFGHAGQKCSAASLGILVGSVGTSERFERQLVDAVRTLRVGPATDPTVHVGPIIEPASGKLLSALTRLEEGESWLVEPTQLDAEGRLWSPGVRQGVQPGSVTHTTEFFGPHLSLIRVDTLEDAIAVQNGTDFGLTAGIHSLDADEVTTWLETVQAGNLYVNRGITGAIVRRQPFGGWRLSQVGPGAKAGGPNYLASLGDWKPVFAQPKRNVMLAGLHARVSSIIESATPQLDFLEFDRIRAGANSDQHAWDAELGVSKDVSALGVERNVLRYRPTEVLVRLADDGTMGQLVRILAAATRARATVRLSSSKPLPPSMQHLIVGDRPALRVEEVVLESDEAFHARIVEGAALAPVPPSAEGHDGFVRSGQPTRRIRVAGADRGLREVLAGNPAVAVYDGEVTVEGRLELLPFLREQAVSITAHRFGNLDPAFVDLRV